MGEFMQNFKIFEGSLLDKMQAPIQAVYPAGGTVVRTPIGEQLSRDNKNASSLARISSASGCPAWRREQPSRCHSSGGSSCTSLRSCRSLSSSMSSPYIYGPQVAQMTMPARISDVIS